MSGSKKVFTTLGSSNHVPEEREAFDYYATDPKAVEMLLELEQFSPVIWEPACGEGHISKVLQAHGYEVISTDLIYRGFGDPEPLDFLKETLDDFEGDIITNPPYSMGLEFVQRALESVRPGGKVAMFLKVQFLYILFHSVFPNMCWNICCSFQIYQSNLLSWMSFLVIL